MNQWVLIHDLVENVDEYFLRYTVFDGYLGIKRIIVNKSNISNTRFAFVLFDTLENANKAILELVYTKLDGFPFKMFLISDDCISAYRNGAGCIKIEGLATDIEISQVHEAFSNFGQVVNCIMPTECIEKQTINHGWCYVQFIDDKCSINAKEKLGIGTEINDKVITVSDVDTRMIFDEHETLLTLEKCYYDMSIICNGECIKKRHNPCLSSNDCTKRLIDLVKKIECG